MGNFDELQTWLRIAGKAGAKISGLRHIIRHLIRVSLDAGIDRVKLERDIEMLIAGIVYENQDDAFNAEIRDSLRSYMQETFADLASPGTIDGSTIRD